MHHSFWDRVVHKYDQEIFNTLEADKRKTIQAAIRKHAARDRDVCDVGCGIGRYLDFLSKNFRHVHAVDYSTESVRRAARDHKTKKNISYHVADMRKKLPAGLPPVPFAISINSLIMPSFRRRMNSLRNIRQILTPGGTLLLVLPSLESALYANFRLFQWNVRTGFSEREAIREGMKYRHMKRGSVSDGLIRIGNLVEKHYIREEIEVILKETGFEHIRFGKAEYGWETEFESPPEWMKRPWVWDWIVTCVKA